MNKSATSKEALLEIARDIAYHEGISKVSIRRLANESHVAIGTVYNYYPSKTDLVAEVMEDFWRNVFHGSHFNTESQDFLGSIQDIYNRISVNLAVFRKEFLEDLPGMEKTDRVKSHLVEQGYLEHMQAGVLMILKRDDRIADSLWDEVFTPEALVEFVFSNMLMLLMEQKEDCRYLCQLLERVLYQTNSKKEEEEECRQ